MENQINLVETNEQEQTAKAAELRKQAQQLLNLANVTESCKVVSADDQRIINQIKDISKKIPSDTAGIIPQHHKLPMPIIPIGQKPGLDYQHHGEVVPIIPIDVDPSEINIPHLGTGRGSQKVTPLFNDRHTAGFSNDEKRDCSKCAKWGKNHCLAKTPAPRKLDGSCEYYLELEELRKPRFLVHVYCPICHNFLSKIEISEHLKCARCYNCGVDIAAHWLSRNTIIEDLENGEKNSNKKIEQIRSESSEANRID